MLKSRWGGIFALGLTVGIVLTLLFLIAAGSIDYPFQNEAQAADHPPIDSKTNAEKNKEEESPLVHWARRFVSYEDTLAQWLMMIFSIAAVFLLRATLRKADETNRAAVEANEIMRAEQRPWLLAKIDPATIRVDISDGRMRVHAPYELRNYGSRPIRYVVRMQPSERANAGGPRAVEQMGRYTNVPEAWMSLLPNEKEEAPGCIGIEVDTRKGPNQVLEFDICVYYADALHFAHYYSVQELRLQLGGEGQVAFVNKGSVWMA